MISFFRKLTWLMRRRRKEDELGEELRFHLEEEAEQRQTEGLAAEQARWAALRDLGSIASVQENTRVSWGWTTLEQLGQDVRYALRTMLANKAFTALAALSLALGIGANTAIYSFMDTLLLRSLPVQDPGSLVLLNWQAAGRGQDAERSPSIMHGVHTRSGSSYRDPQKGYIGGIVPYAAFELFRKDDSAFTSVFAHYQPSSFTLSVKGEADIASGEYVSGDFFRGLGVPAASGRLIVSDDDRAGAEPVAILSHSLSQSRFGGPAQAVGQSILINNIAFTVAGVTPPEFFGVNPGIAPDFYLPMHANLLFGGDIAGWYLAQNTYWIEVMARLRPGVSIQAAQATWAAPFRQWVESTATNDQERANLPVLLIREGGGGLDALRRRYSKPLYMLMTLVGFILAIACANIANLLLARATARRREMAVRLGMGATRSRVVRQLLTESILLASLGGILGLLVAYGSIRFLTLLLGNGALHSSLDWHVMGLAGALSLLTGVVFGLVPAIQSTRADVIPALKEVRASHTPSRFRVSLSQVLIVAQIALSLLMLVAAGLFIRTLSNLQSVQLGFNRDNLLLFQLNARQAGHQDAEITSFYTELQKRFNALPGVRIASLSHESLLNAGTGQPISVPGAERDSKTRLLYVGPAFFTTMQIPILLGRDIDDRDQPGSPAVVVISEQFAKKNFGEENPLGRHLTLGGRDPRDMEIVGVVREARYGGLKREVPPVVYIPYNQGSHKAVAEMTFVLRTSSDPLGFVNTVREIAHQADARVPVSNVQTQSAQIDELMGQEIAFAKLCSAFAFLALVVACVGLYGTLSYNIARRTGEIGIRMALGARRGSVVWMVLRDVVVFAAAGLAISVPIALATSTLVASFLFDMKPNDPLALTLAVVILLASALLAGYAPARKASRIDPMIALRHQ
ncbi:MAG: ABC transporter permease [Acidobacteriota bacterium]